MPCPNERRIRNKTIAFRATPEENDAITLLAEASGMNSKRMIRAPRKRYHHELSRQPSIP